MLNSKFTIDTEGKDTWRQKEAGADLVISLSLGELAYIERTSDRSTLSDAMQHVPEDTQILICEGLKGDYPGVLRIITAKTKESLKETFEVRGMTNDVIALSGIMANETKEHEEYPVFNCLEQEGVRALADLILEKADKT
jgi:molybdopterin-guanine dinucleotide biosynthesis protein MobB